MGNLKFYLIDNNKINLIKPLWEKLNKHHKNKSEDFKDYFDKLVFEERMQKVLEKENLDLRIEIVEDINQENIVSYCISSVTDTKEGEINSIYIESDYRGLGIGDKLMKSSLAWMEEKEVDSKRIAVSCGNEDVFKFYKKYGFNRKMTILKG